MQGTWEVCGILQRAAGSLESRVKDRHVPWIGPCAEEDLPDELRWEASLSHMSRSATEARSRATAGWITDHVGARRRYRPLPGKGLRRRHLRSVRKEFGGRFYQFLSGHAVIGSYVRDKIHKTDSDRCWW